MSVTRSRTNLRDPTVGRYVQKAPPKTAANSRKANRHSTRSFLYKFPRRCNPLNRSRAAYSSIFFNCSALTAQGRDRKQSFCRIDCERGQQNHSGISAGTGATSRIGSVARTNTHHRPGGTGSRVQKQNRIRQFFYNVSMRSFHPDCVVLDVQMPGMNGLERCGVNFFAGICSPFGADQVQRNWSRR